MSFSEYLDEELGESKDLGSERRYNCPFCGTNDDFKLYVKVAYDDTDGLWHCKKCDLSGNPLTFIMKHNDYRYDEAKDLLSLYDYELTPYEREAKEQGLSTEEQLLIFMSHKFSREEQADLAPPPPVKLKPPSLPIGYRNDWNSPDAYPFLDYLINKRHFTFEDIALHNVGFITNGYTLTDKGKHVNLTNHVIFLTHGDDGMYQYWNSRSIEPKPFIKTFNAPAQDGEYSKRTTVFNLNRARFQKDIVICEGVPDALTLGASGVATFGKQVTEEQVNLIVNSITPEQHIYLMLDNDALKSTDKLRKALYEKHKNTFLVLNPTNEDANSMGWEASWQLIRNNSVEASDDGMMLLYLL